MTNRKINIAHALMAAALVVIGGRIVQPPLTVSETTEITKVILAKVELATP